MYGGIFVEIHKMSMGGMDVKEENNEFIKVFNYFENANARNRDAFIELLNYTIKNKRGSKTMTSSVTYQYPYSGLK